MGRLGYKGCPFVKRLFDILLSAAVLVVLLPLLGTIALLVRINLGCPILFTQARPGLHGQPYELFKFRTMTNERDEHGALLPSDARLTAFGRWLRASSLDELPSLWNVFKGDMSFVGPRPLLMSYLPLYSSEQRRRHEVRPGITGWAQINGRNALSWDEKFRLDVWYVDNRSFQQDLLILVKTIGVVFKRSGINASDGKIMERFKGNGEE